MQLNKETNETNHPEPITEAENVSLGILQSKLIKKIKNNRPDLVVKNYKKKHVFKLICHWQEIITYESKNIIK